jgi:hypothetical protein
MNQAETICTLLIVVAALAIFAKNVAMPYPVLLVIGFYDAFMLLLVVLIFRAVAIEFRSLLPLAQRPSRLN